jgi:Nucleoporin protein Ndc1-Nup
MGMTRSEVCSIGGVSDASAAALQSSETTTPSSLETQQFPPIPVKQDNIFTAKDAKKLPFDFARSGESSQLKPTSSSVAPLSGFLEWPWLKLRAIMPASQWNALSLVLSTPIELQAVQDLPHKHLAVLAVQGMSFLRLYSRESGISQLVVKSATEDQLGLVQWDIGVWLNCLCSTLFGIEKYLQTLTDHSGHTPESFVHRKYIISEQDALIKAIRLALWEIVNEFGRHLDQAGLDSATADFCQKILDIQSK